MSPDAQYVIQTRQKGAWLRCYGGSSRWAMDKSWETFCNVQRCAARYVECEGERVRKILATKKSRPHEKRR